TPAADAIPLAVASGGAPRRGGRALALAATIGAFALAVGLWFALRPGVPATAASGSVAATASATAPTAAGADLPRNSIAVLPFRNLSRSEVDETFALGIADTLLYQLSASPELLVIARSSSFAYRDPPGDLRVVGSTLGARYLLEGSLQSAAGQLRLNVRLIDSTSGQNLWSLRFDRRIEDVFALQDEIATQVARILRVSLSGRRNLAGEDQGTTNVDAYFEYLQGRNLTSSRRVSDLQAAAAHLAKAVELDATYAAAHAELAHAQELLLTYEPPADAASRDRRWDEAVGNARRALQLAPASALANVALGRLTEDPDTALDYLRRAVALNPNLAQAWAAIAEKVVDMGTDAPADMQGALDKARQLDPLEPRNHYLKALQSLLLRDAQQTEALLRATLAVDPEYYAAYARLAQVQGCCTGRIAEAIRNGEQALQLDPKAVWVRRMLAALYLDVGDVTAAKQLASSDTTADPGTQMLLDLYRRDTAAAAALVLDERQRDRLLHSETGETEFAGRVPLLRADQPALLQQARRFAAELVPPAKVLPKGKSADPGAQIDFAATLLRTGDAERGRELLNGALREIEARRAKYGAEQTPALHVIALALTGKRDDALGLLESSSTAGPWASWWYYAYLEPGLNSLRGEPRFTAWVQRAVAHSAAEREQLQALRKEGLVPDRSERAGNT
ncbi:MAG TPA: tetratricopeptide repeat protein, partial [Steroidobacteraceae bacterium]|nr:tetratricopeptide repeat protein [Steroidobacteraceae bacterium]